MAVISAAVVIAIAVVAGLVASSLPGEVPLPIHWGLDGEPDRFADKWTALMMPGLLAGGVSLLFYFLPSLESRREGLQRSRGLYLSTWTGILIFSLLIELSVVAVALKWPVHATSLMIAGLGILFVLIGNQLGKSRSMYLIGIRTPWTLASEEVWIKTHRLAGKLMVVGGAAMLVAAVLPLPSGLMATLMLAVIAAVVGVPVIYSFLLWRKESRQGQASG
ncbi:MAG TPA: SdpI family protein [Sphingomicrobium sp.]|nr:SdpI family protein [Sphingomicrobium sp.]